MTRSKSPYFFGRPRISSPSCLTLQISGSSKDVRIRAGVSYSVQHSRVDGLDREKSMYSRSFITVGAVRERVALGARVLILDDEIDVAPGLHASARLVMREISCPSKRSVITTGSLG